MKNKIANLKKLVALVALLLLIPAHSVYASSSIYVALGSKTAYYGNTVLVGIRMNSSSDVNAVQANILYPADKLTYVSTSFVGSAFEIQAESSAGGGAVRIARGTTATLNGDNSIALLVFRAKADSGSATITVSSDSNLVNNGIIVSSGGSGSTVSFASAPPAPPAAPAPVVDTTAPTISEITVTGVLPTTATINWKTNENADSIVEYGPSNAYGLSISSTERTNTHKLVLSSTFIMPKTAYHYRISTTDESGNKTVSEDKTFMTSGYAVLVTVVNNKNRPVAGVTVTVDGITTRTDAKGKAMLNVTLGQKTAVATKDNNSVSGSLTVTNDSAKTTQVKLFLDQKNKFAVLSYIGGGLALFALGVLSSALVFMHLRPKIEKTLNTKKAKRQKYVPRVTKTTPIENNEIEL